MPGFDDVFGVGTRIATIRRDGTRVAVATSISIVIDFFNKIYIKFNYIRFRLQYYVDTANMRQVKVVCVD